MPDSGTFAIRLDLTAGSGLQASGAAVSTTLFMLPPVPIMGLDGPQLYLVTLVDERYFWHQFAGAGTITCTAATATWSGLIDQLAAQLGITIHFTTPDSVYGQPEPDSALYSNNESPAALLDAVAANVGCVVVRHLGELEGTYSLQRFADAVTALNDNRPETSIMGGEAFDGESLAAVGNVMPESVTVVFPKWLVDSGYIEPTTYPPPSRIHTARRGLVK